MEEVSNRDGRTILFVSHQLNSIIKLCTRSIWLEKGELKQAGSVNEIIEAYTNSIKKEQETAHYKRDPGPDDYYFSDIQVKTPHINVGEDLSICIGFNEKYRNQRLILNINVVDETDELISHIINDDDDFSTENIKSKIWITLKELNLRPGRYFLSCWAGFDMQYAIDWVDKAVAFEIHELNNFTRRVTPFPVNSKIIIRSQWQAD